MLGDVSSSSDAVSPAKMQEMRALIDVQVSASIIANGNNKRVFGRRVLAVLPEIHAEVERAFKRALRMAAGTDLESVKASALENVAAKLDSIFRRYDLSEELANLPANAHRAERLRRRNEVRSASYHFRFACSMSAVNDNAQLQALLSRMDEVIRDTIFRLCTNTAHEGEMLHLVVTIEDDTPHAMYTYHLFSRDGAGVGHGAGADWEKTYISGSSYFP